MEFFTFLLEQYAAHKNTTADKILKTLDEFGLTDFVIGMYEMYHSEAIENAFTDIDRLISQKCRLRHDRAPCDKKTPPKATSPGGSESQ